MPIYDTSYDDIRSTLQHISTNAMNITCPSTLNQQRHFYIPSVRGLNSTARNHYLEKLRYERDTKILPVQLIDGWIDSPRNWPDITFGDIFVYHLFQNVLKLFILGLGTAPSNLGLKLWSCYRLLLRRCTTLFSFSVPLLDLKDFNTSLSLLVCTQA